MIKIYRDEEANAIFMENANGAQFLNSLQATIPDNGLVTIIDLARDIDVVSNTPHTEFVQEDGTAYTGPALDICNTLNAIFQTSGSSQGIAPTITSSLAVSSTEGDSLNYELTANYGVGYEWDLASVSGVTTVEGNIRKLVGGSSLAAGTYNIPVKVINYNGEASQTLVLTVNNPPFSNTKSIDFANKDYLGANASLLSSVLGRTGNGSGSSDAWTIGFYYKASSSSHGQTIFYFGDSDDDNGGYILVTQQNSGGSKALRLRYGSNNNNLEIRTDYGSLTPGTWQHVLVSYDGGTTGSSSGSLNDYYSRFKIYIDGVLETTNNSQDNYGWAAGIDSDNLRVGKFTSGNYMRDCRVDELSIWGSDQSANSSVIYNSGTPFDLTTLGTSPTHWWRMGDGDTYPTLQDSVGTAHFTMYSMTVADIVNDVP